MPVVAVEIVAYLSDHQPGFVAVQLTDAFDSIHTFHDKVPVFTNQLLDHTSLLPVPGLLGCELVETLESHGRLLARIDTERPWDVESISGQYEFVVMADSVIDE